MKAIGLPAPQTQGDMSLATALATRRSRRSFRPQEALTRAELSQLLWAAQGISDSQAMRTAPSAGALFPVEVHVAISRVDDLAPGIYHYQVQGHRLERLAAGDPALAIWRSALRQDSVREAAVNLLVAAVPERTARKYGQRARRYVQIEVGHVGQNVLLTATALGLGAVPIGAFDDRALAAAFGLRAPAEPLYLIPIGR